MMDFFSTASGRIMDSITYVQRMQRRPTLSPDPVEDISDMYCLTLNKEDIIPQYFTTCKSHKLTMEIQEFMFAQLWGSNSFWSFVGDQTKNIIVSPNQKIMQEIIKLGIPPKYRSRIWQTMCGTFIKPMNFLAYSDLFTLNATDEETRAQIAQDVNRTFPGIGKPNFIERLSRVLTAYSLRNPKLGYCQSMNFLAGTLLIFMEEEPAFWMLVYLVEELLHNYYVPTMAGFHIDSRVFEKLLELNMPDLHKHFIKTHVSVTILTAPWFLCLFTNDLPTETTYWVWDNLFLDGIVVIFEVALAILRMVRSELLLIDEQADLIQYVRQFTSNIHDPSRLRKYWSGLDKKRIMKLRSYVRKQVEEDASRATLNKLFCELELATHFEPEELGALWRQYTSIDPFLRFGSTNGLDLNQFIRLVKGTLTEWEVDPVLASWLFTLSDVNSNGIIDFSELAMLLSVICRGTFKQIVNFNFHVFDIGAKGGIAKQDLRRMLKSIYFMFRNDSAFDNLVNYFVSVIFDTCNKNSSGHIPIQSFEYVVLIQPQIMHRFAARNHQIKYDQKATYYYWMFDPERKERQKREPQEVIMLGYAQQANIYDNQDSHSNISSLAPKSFDFWQFFFGSSRETCIA